jgi:hypothetical protein
MGEEGREETSTRRPLSCVSDFTSMEDTLIGDLFGKRLITSFLQDTKRHHNLILSLVDNGITMTTFLWITRIAAGSCFILTPMRFLFLVTLILLVGVCNSMVVAPPSSRSPATTTAEMLVVRVCTGADCRVDGASECLRMMQQLASTSSSNNTDKTLLKVKASPCLGPCGDGPNVVVMDGTTNKRIVDTELQAQKSGSGSVVPADIFGASVTGVYQVRTSQDAARVMNLAIGILRTSLDYDQKNVAQAASSNFVALGNNDNNTVVVITSNRAWYDRPRNERLMLQRLMHVSILAGLASYDTSHGGSELSNLQWGTAAILWIASNFIMKESLLEMVLLKAKKQLRIKYGMQKD